MRTLTLALLSAALLGCVDVSDFAGESSDAPAGANDAADGGNTAPAPVNNRGGGGGDFDGLVIDNARAVNPGGGTPAPNEGHPNPAPQPAPQPTIPLVEAKLVDMRQAMADNPDLKVVDGQAQGGDPLSFAASAYMNVPQRIGGLTFEYTARQMQAANDGKPLTLQQYRDLMQKMQAEFKRLRPYRMYGYDPQTGKVVILEDTAMKKRIYEEKGIPLDE